MSAVLCKTALHSTTWMPIDFYLVAFSSVFSTKLCLASISINRLSGHVSPSPLSLWLINTYYLLQTWSFRFQRIFFFIETLFIVLHFPPSCRKNSKTQIAIRPRLTKMYFMIKNFDPVMSPKTIFFATVSQIGSKRCTYWKFQQSSLSCKQIEHR